MAMVPGALKLMAAVPGAPRLMVIVPEIIRQLPPLSQLPGCSLIAIDALKACDHALNLLRTFWSSLAPPLARLL